MTNLNIPGNSNETLEADAQKSRSKIVELLKGSKTLLIGDVAAAIGLKEEEKTLPNGRTVKSVNWTPENLAPAYQAVNQCREESGLGRNDSVTIDGACPTFVLPALSHAMHPTQTSVAYPQGNTSIPLSGAAVEGAGQAKDVTLKVTETDDTIVVEFNLAQPTIDAAETVKGLIAPALPSQGKGVCVTGRGPVALAAALAEAYAHKVPYIANFVPGTGYVVSISHDAKFPLGTVIPAKK